MKATINEIGELKIKAETPLEAYALGKWNSNYMTGDESSLLTYDLYYKEEAKNGNQR